MKNNKYIYSKITLIIALVFLAFVSCERETSDNLPLATFSNNSEVYIDGFSSGLEYYPFADSKQTAFTVDDDVKYKGTTSMRFDIPNAGDPEGAYAGAIFRDDNGGRDLSGYNALTFWAKGSQSAIINEVGYGNDFGDNKYLVSLQNLSLTTNWVKYIIPIPDASKLIQERGMFWYAEGPEDDKGYTFWIDELKFEQIETISQSRSAILNGNDETEGSFIGSNITIGGLTHTVMVGSGIDITVNAAPGYFDFNSSNVGVATISELGLISVVDAGTTIITASLGNEEAAGSLKIESLGDFQPAPLPSQEPKDVISIFSNAFTNEPVEYYNGYWAPFQTTQGQDDVRINGDDIIKYSDLNFVGIQFTKPTIDISQMTNFHIDVNIQAPNPIDGEDYLKIQLVDIGPDNTFGTSDDSSGEIALTSPTLLNGSWVSIDLPLSSLSGLTSKANLAQVVFISDATITDVLIDNIYFYIGSGPAQAAPVPTQNPDDVISVYSDAFTNIEGTDYNPGWGQTTIYSEESIVGNNAMLYKGLNYQGIVLGSAQDVSAMEFLHIDFWSANSTALNAFLISSGPSEKAKALTVPTTGWASIDIPLSDFSGVDLTGIIQMKFDGDGDIYLDNIYFYKTGGSNSTEPLIAAPTPTIDGANVISIYSDFYTNIEGINFNPDWGQATVQSEVQIAGNNTQLYTDLNYQGIDFSENSFNATAMTNFHMDVWIPNEVLDKVLTVKGVDFGGGSAESSAFELTITHTLNGNIPALKQSTWVSIDVPISDFSGDLTRTDLAQIVIAGSVGDVYLDNIFFYKTGDSSATEPTTAAPTPTITEADVISVYSDAYSNVSGTDYNPGWGQTTVYSEELIAGNNTMLYTGLNYQGIVLGSAQDVSAMEFLHIDFWSANSAALNAFVISSGPVETAKALTVPTTGWGSIDIPLSDFSPVNLADIIQMKFDGDGDIYLDNIYFYKSGGTTEECTDTTLALPIDFDCQTIDYASKIVGNVSFSVIDNPELTGINSQVSKVGSIINKGENWENAFFNLDTPIDFSANNTVKFKFFSSVSVDIKLKMEDGTANPIEVDVNHGGTGWEELNFTFSSSESYNDMVLFVDGPGNTSGTFYIDDIELVASSEVTGGGCTSTVVAATTFPVNFEACETFLSTFTDSGSITTELTDNPEKEGINTSDFVLKVIKAAGTNRWAGFQNPFPNNFDATKTLKLKVYSSKANVVMRFEVNSNPQDSGSGNPGPQFVTIENANTWTEIEINFTGIPSTNTGLNQIVIKPDNPEGSDGETTSSEGIYYFDDIRFE
jgi:hypothetical protein